MGRPELRRPPCANNDTEQSGETWREARRGSAYAAGGSTARVRIVVAASSPTAVNSSALSRSTQAFPAAAVVARAPAPVRETARKIFRRTAQDLSLIHISEPTRL